MANIINKIDKIDARASDWIHSNYPTAPYYYIAGASWVISLMGVTMVALSHWSNSAYDVFAGLGITIVGTAVSTLLTVWAHNEIENIRRSARKSHPSYQLRHK